MMLKCTSVLFFDYNHPLNQVRAIFLGLTDKEWKECKCEVVLGWNRSLHRRMGFHIAKKNIQLLNKAQKVTVVVSLMTKADDKTIVAIINFDLNYPI